MKTFTSILAAGLIFAFAAVAANAQIPSSPVAGGSHLKAAPGTIVEGVIGGKSLQARIDALTAKIKTLKGKNGALKAEKKALQDRLWVLNHSQLTPPYPPITEPPYSECQTYGNGCTPEELCEYWGMNCDQVVTPVLAPAVVETQPTVGGPASTETAPVAAPAQIVSADLPCATQYDPAVTFTDIGSYDWSC